MSKNLLKKKKAVIISPHRDDAAISIGDYVRTHSEEIFVLNIFTNSVGTILDIPDGKVSQVRKDEDLEIKEKFGFKFLDCGLPDTSMRGVGWDDYDTPIDWDLLAKVQKWILEKLEETGGCDTLWIPAAYGLHPDHYLCTLAFSEGALLEMLSKVSFKVYCDQQYYYEGKTFHKGHGYLRENATLHSHKFDYDKKKEMVSVYKSQLSQSRIDLLTKTIQKEYYWETDPKFFKESSKR
jgi:LmbE family N-acetylglucosaminyl deacetylase